MRVAFVYPWDDAYSDSKPLRDPICIHLGISYISSFLKMNGHSTQLFVLTQNNQEKVEELLAQFSPQLICFTAVSTTYYIIKNFASIYKAKRSNAWLMAGGCHVSLNPEDVIADSFNAICIGEGEYPVLEFVEQLERETNPSGIHNLWIKNGSEIQRNPTRNYIENLNQLPFLDRAMWDEWIQYPEDKNMILMGRGCPFNCSYCCNHKLGALAEGKYNRFRSPENILAEVKELVTKHPQTKEINLECETIGTDLEFALQLCSALEEFQKERDHPLTFGVNLRVIPNVQYEPLFEAFQRANIRIIFIGLESGSDRVRRQILRRIYSNDDIIRAVTLAKAHGFSVKLFLMIGLPGETPEDFQQTIEVCQKCQADLHSLYIFFPYPGTDLAVICEEQGLVGSELIKGGVRERREVVLNQPQFSRKQVLKSYIWFEYNVYKGYKPLYKRFMFVVRRRLMLSPLLTKFSGFLLKNAVLAALNNRLLK